VIEVQFKKVCCSIDSIVNNSRTPFDKMRELLMMIDFKEMQLEKSDDGNEVILDFISMFCNAKQSLKQLEPIRIDGK
jgi:hypothetical protein